MVKNPPHAIFPARLLAAFTTPFAVMAGPPLELPPPACVKLNVWPAIVNVPVRESPVLASTEYPTEPVPVPEVPEVICIQDTFGEAFQVQLASVVTATPPLPPEAGMVFDVGAIVYEHVEPPTIWKVSVNTWLPLSFAITFQLPGMDAGACPAISRGASVRHQSPASGIGSKGPLAGA